MLLSTLIKDIKIEYIHGENDPEIKGIAYDSRKVQPGYVFVAVEGFKTDGHIFLERAVKAGAVALVLEKDVPVPEGVTVVRVKQSRPALALLAASLYRHPSGKLEMIGVTGTNGKTTTTSLIDAIYRGAGIKTGLIGTIANRVGDRTVAVSHTTPESADLQALLGEMAGEGVGAVVMEVSSHALALKRVAGVEYDVAVFTNLTRDHLDFHRDMDDYLAVKAALFSGLGSGSKGQRKFAVINADDPRAGEIIAVTGVPVVTYGIRSKADITAGDIEIASGGVSFTARGKETEIRLNLKLTGMFNVYNALAAYSLGVVRGFSPERIKASLEGVDGVAGRFEAVRKGQDFTVIVDYAHTPDGLENILQTAREITRGRLITVFGCGGDRDRQKRPMMGEIAVRLSDLAIVTSDNPRTEDPLRIIEDIKEGIHQMPGGASYDVEPDRRAAIKKAIFGAKSGDVVVIAGKGHEDYQIIGDTRHHFDDREEAARFIEDRMQKGPLS
ncbi:UDP-N-acetylmuramoylalanyl-D-glutamate--2,6-diaminopimelate ligase [Desulfocucumis palustris]|uniref:UDP-N-acetylmuramoyl-L-alanyl-D-glutamate--2,6-diaminopimelate ligase n=1 Tax=Desulfocucumis palustris TaxID=1898651 RepID=A0A2L2XE72_9FIRM|nr:UDP-N-acetylmuramoyl-L-alanyl-D-glutamate--2,6-diaminopimelate ligase [Desulfocucumis palustris]GBF34460.1 UDP-N-acetylmuramoylalanyl-D-glutamate--2,6-diaminopimelate ligase [Desulfocucumis palustris]